jgi:hypothetical protein
MSNHPLRKETNCLNCGAEVTDRFCSHCGQENIEPRENFWQLLVHFFNDFTHFDGKFFSTIRVLLLQPGKLTREYIAGRRAGYLHPIRMYLFISFAFFILQYLIPSPEEDFLMMDRQVVSRDSVIHLIDNKIISLNKSLNDSSTEIQQLLTRERVVQLEKKRWLLNRDSSNLNSIYSELVDTTFTKSSMIGSFKIGSNSGDTVLSASLYEFYQQQLPPEKRDGKIDHFLNKRLIALREKYNGKIGVFGQDFGKTFLLYLPKMLFVSLPITAWILLLLYIRRKRWWYTEHAILTIHLYCGVFIILLLQLIFTSLLTGLKFPVASEWADSIFSVGILFYLFFTLYRFYQQSIGKTCFKMILFLLLQSISFGILFFLFGFISLITI